MNLYFKEKLFNLYDEIMEMRDNNVPIDERVPYFDGGLNEIEKEIEEKHNLDLLDNEEIEDLKGLIGRISEVCRQGYLYDVVKEVGKVTL